MSDVHEILPHLTAGYVLDLGSRFGSFDHRVQMAKYTVAQIRSRI